MRLVDSYSTTRQVPRRTCFCLLARVTMTTKGRRTLVILMCPSLSSKGQVVRQFQLVHKFIRSQLAIATHILEREQNPSFLFYPQKLSYLVSKFVFHRIFHNLAQQPRNRLLFLVYICRKKIINASRFDP